MIDRHAQGPAPQEPVAEAGFFQDTAAFGVTFGRPPVVVVKKRRRLDVIGEALADASAQALADGTERKPRVFVVPPAAGSELPEGRSLETSEQAAPASPGAELAVPRRRARRDPLRMPGAVVHVVYPDRGTAEEPADPPGIDLALPHNADEYAQVLEALRGVEKLVKEAASAARFRILA
jgi:hypothetical protein